MIKNLFIIRHATAEDIGNLTVVRDYDRELISKGIMESAKLGKALSDYFPKVDAIYSSGAARALNTATIVAEQIKFDTDLIEIKEALYGSGPRGYLEVLNSIPDEIENAVIVGHNPDISYFTDYLTRDDVGGSLKKASLVHLRFEGFQWNELSQNSGGFIFRIEGKKLEAN